jgi:ABC-type glycerol-3-phosphate transport system substrate-binding protein
MAAFSKAYLAGLLAVLTGAAVLAGCGTDSTSSGGGGGAQTIQIWEGYTAAEAKAFSHLVAE